MYGWLRGIIFSKLALSVSFQAASAASSTVSSAHATSTMRRLLKTMRSSHDPDWGSNWSSVAGTARSALASVACMGLSGGPAGQGQGMHAARSCDHERAGGGLRDRGGRQRAIDRSRREGGAIVAAHEHVAGLAHEHEAPVVGARAAGDADLQRGAH